MPTGGDIYRAFTGYSVTPTYIAQSASAAIPVIHLRTIIVLIPLKLWYFIYPLVTSRTPIKKLLVKCDSFAIRLTTKTVPKMLTNYLHLFIKQFEIFALLSS